ncbi:MAG: N-acetylmuramoyl-L-alanine amidase [Odoribacteraceae bacterium]|jgi:hypothetical protein|nr:N-acetylmuramoyl-L-alanine amidase [Odoribacteraceae bacterium]
MGKQLAYLVIHCTATAAGREVTAGEIRSWHTSPPPAGRGWQRVGYTDLVHLDGRVERLVENNEDGVVDPREETNGAAGYNGVARHVCYVGGTVNGQPADTRTPRQRDALARYVLDFHARHPGVKIVGHRDLPGVKKACPSFDVGAWLTSIGIGR